MATATSYLGLDIGTSSVKALLIDEAQTVIAEAAEALEVRRPHPHWSEQDPQDWWRATLAVVDALRREVPEAWRGLAGIGLSGQMHGATLLDGKGRVLRPAILWNDGRSEPECAELERRVPDLRHRTANIAMPGFTAPKLIWVKAHEPDVFAAMRMVLLPKDYVRYRLTGSYRSDMSDAAGTLWLDMARRCWDETVLGACDMTIEQVPGLVEGSDVSALLSPEIASAWDLPGRSVPVAGGGGDNAASAVGIGAVRPAEGFLSLGTSGVLFAATDRLAAKPERTAHAFCHAVPGRWHVMAVTLSAASALSWAAGALGAGEDIEALLRRVEDFAADAERRVHAPIFLPYLSGERTPHNDAQASAVFAGLRAEHGPEAIVYAVLEGVAFSLADGYQVLREADAPLTSCMLVGGGSRSAFWGQLLADALRIPLDLPSGAAAGAASGAARLAMLAAGAGTEEEICLKPALERRFSPRPERFDELAPRLARFRALYQAEKRARTQMRDEPHAAAASC
jgi:xylulokinase